MLKYSMMDCVFSRYIYPAKGSQLYYQLGSVAGIHSAGMDITNKFLKLDLHTVFTYLFQANEFKYSDCFNTMGTTIPQYSTPISRTRTMTASLNLAHHIHKHSNQGQKTRGSYLQTVINITGAVNTHLLLHYDTPIVLNSQQRRCRMRSKWEPQTCTSR